MTIKWDTTATTAPRLERAMKELGHTNVTWDQGGFGSHVRGTCEHGCTGILVEGVHSYGTGLDACSKGRRQPPPFQTEIVEGGVRG